MCKQADQSIFTVKGTAACVQCLTNNQVLPYKQLRENEFDDLLAWQFSVIDEPVIEELNDEPVIHE